MYYILPLRPDNYKTETSGMLTQFKSFSCDESGATAIEYGLIAALVSMAAIASMRGLGESLSNLFTSVSGEIAGAVNSAG